MKKQTGIMPGTNLFVPPTTAPTKEKASVKEKAPVAEVQETRDTYVRTSKGYRTAGGAEANRLSLYMDPEYVRQVKAAALLMGYKSPRDYVLALVGADLRRLGLTPPWPEE